MNTPAIIFQRICRTCMKQDQNFHSIYENSENQLKICEMLATVIPQLLMYSNDQLPQLLCVACLNKLNIAYSFQQMCIASEKQLLDILCADSTLISNELPHPANTQVGQDPLLEEELPKFTICIKSEDKTEPEDVKYTILEDYALTAQQVDAVKSEIESQPEDFCATNTISKSIESEATENDTETKEDVKYIIMEDYALTAQQVDTVKRDIESHPEDSCATNTNSKSIESEVTSEDEDDSDEDPHKTLRISDMHNETGVNEIEKPSPYHRRSVSLPCLHCDKVFDRIYNFKRHARTHSATGRFKIKPSTECDAPKKPRQIRKRPSPPPDGFKCSECPRRFEKGQSLASHMKVHRKTIDIQTFKCDMCPKKFHKFTKLAKHVQTHPENQRHKCTLCEKTFALEAHFIEHMNKHNGLKSYVCVYCHKAFLHNSFLVIHQRSHTGEKPYLCAQCGKSFINARNLKDHQLRHSDEKRFQCPECPSRFTCKSNLIKHRSRQHIHKKKHIVEKPHKCRECNMSFISANQLGKHEFTHTAKKSHKCTFCERVFELYADLYEHLHLHVDEKTYMCDQCPEKFKYKADLHEHHAMHYKQLKAIPAFAAATTSVEPNIEVEAEV